MNKIKGLCTSLLGGAALAAMASGGQADELAALKAQLAALESHVNGLEQAPPSGLRAPLGASLVTFGTGFADELRGAEHGKGQGQHRR
jgi:hypothetical protein